MRAADQWAQIEGQLPLDWNEARLAFTPEGSPDDAAHALGPLQPVRVASGEFCFHVSRVDGGAERARNTLRALDRKRVWGTVALIDVSAEVPAAVTDGPAAPALLELPAAWDAVLAELPPDWSDVLCELELDSSDHIPRAALLGAPMNPTRVPDEIAIRFRASGKQGYGVSAQMARRCFERMDAEGITGRIRLIYEISDSENAVTQGPVWRVAGKSV